MTALAAKLGSPTIAIGDVVLMEFGNGPPDTDNSALAFLDGAFFNHGESMNALNLFIIMTATSTDIPVPVVNSTALQPVPI